MWCSVCECVCVVEGGREGGRDGEREGCMRSAIQVTHIQKHTCTHMNTHGCLHAHSHTRDWRAKL